MSETPPPPTQPVENPQTEETKSDSPNINVFLNQLLDSMGFLGAVSPDPKNLSETMPHILARAKLLYSANKDLRTNYQNIKQELDQLVAAKGDETERDRLIRDLTQRLHQVRELNLKTATEFQKQLSAQPNAEKMTEVLSKIEEFKPPKQRFKILNKNSFCNAQ